MAMGPRRTVHVTANFAGNLEAVRLFLEESEASRAFESLLEHLFEWVIPNLERFPDLGADFWARAPRSTEGHARLAALRARLGDGVELRQYITGDYLLLYAVRGSDIYLLSLRHHRQLSFDLRRFWSR